jgi:hypothetical protein
MPSLKSKYAFVVAVPKTDPAAYNPDRPVSTLIANQIKHLHDVELTMPADRQTGTDISTLTTERQASRYIQQVTATLHPQGVPKATRATRRAKVKKAAGAKTKLRKAAGAKTKARNTTGARMKVEKTAGARVKVRKAARRQRKG